MRNYFVCFFGVTLALFVGCKFRKKTAAKGTTFIPVNMPGPRALVYKTTNDYSNYVPVTLDDSGKTITSYPDPSDISAVGIENKKPLPLRSGYLLDNHGIHANIAYLDLTWKEYSQMKITDPSLLQSHIKDRKPIKEMCDCGLKTEMPDLELKLNRLIKDKSLRTTCTTLK